MPKAAGTSITQVLEKNYSKNKVIDCVFMHDYRQYNKENFNDYLLYKGHIHYEFARNNFPLNTKYITVLRDPVDRIISQYYYIKKTPANFLSNPNIEVEQRRSIELAKNKGITDYLLADLPDIKQSTRNQQLNVLSEKQWFYVNEGNTEVMVKGVMKTLDSFDCVGVQEFLPFFILEMCNKFEFKYSTTPKVNINPDRQVEHNRLGKEEREEVLEIITRYNAEEIVVYNNVRKLIQNKINKLLEEFLKGNYSSVRARALW